ncbi:diaminopimelate epimerase [Azonexus sp.]|uniref:diaminopimelate epimerase n=1 Tax=Azonexus sp. TaxID=1872668 RepID=UPI0039E6F75E
MAAGLRFTKMHGIGNDYVYVNGFVETVQDPAALARSISERHFGVGSDGLVLILPSNVADARMRMFNADGSESEMCGNAVRCVGKYVYDAGICPRDSVRIETLAGVKELQLRFAESGVVDGAVVDMGEPELIAARIPLCVAKEGATQPFVAHPVHIDGHSYALTAVSMGNPHAVVFMDGIDQLDLPRLGPLFEHHPLFPRRTNTEFVEVLSRHKLRMRVWERGAGETLACGTGACAVAVAAVLEGRAERSVEIELRGGSLHIEWDASNQHVYMAGGATTVFAGTYPL